MIRRPPRSTQGVSSAASDVYKRQVHGLELDDKDKFSKSVKIKLTLLTNDLTNQAVEAFQNNDYELALKSFEQILDIQDIPVVKEDNPEAVDTVTTARYHTTKKAIHRKSHKQNRSQPPTKHHENLKTNQNLGTKTTEKTTPDRRRCLLYTSPSPRDLSTSRMPSSA
eukprot:TRINITY_DN70084_c0_g1_i1.p2 TRINITY_DN70084_c0_g1~~TRINITY_DN70084_c0_g1_i1.p2  ORF type:complete len:167 (+),score=35.07 TRINITY_DN70084_c0_g1_i1:139-639(+)